MRIYLLLDGKPITVMVNDGAYLAPVVLTIEGESGQGATLALDETQLYQLETAIRSYRDNKTAASAATLTAGTVEA